MAKVDINSLSFQYPTGKQKQPVLKGLNFSVSEGESLGIIGANGAGKSTLLKLMVGLLQGYEGSIVIDGISVEKKNLAQVRRKLGYVFQDSDSQLFMNTVAQDVAFGPINYGLPKEEVESRVASALKSTHIEDLADRHIYQLSGGQKKLAAIAGVLAIGNDVILMDEPSVALDPSNRENLISVLKSLSGVRIIASHDLDFIYDVCDRVVLLDKGEIAADGRADEILKDRELLEAHGLRLPLSFRFLR